VYATKLLLSRTGCSLKYLKRHFDLDTKIRSQNSLFSGLQFFDTICGLSENTLFCDIDFSGNVEVNIFYEQCWIQWGIETSEYY